VAFDDFSVSNGAAGALAHAAPQRETTAANVKEGFRMGIS
jgi:hypothetical protein